MTLVIQQTLQAPPGVYVEVRNEFSSDDSRSPKLLQHAQDLLSPVAGRWRLTGASSNGCVRVSTL